MSDSLTPLLKKLRLSGLGTLLEVRLHEAASSGLTHRDFLPDEAMEGHDKMIQRYLKPDLLIIDDMGMQALPKRSGEYLFELIMRRHEVRSTMMTSNRPLEEWGKLIGDVPAATAILDRFLHHCALVQITGRSYRLENSRRSPNGENSQKSSKGTKAPTAPSADK